jgi:hypothetical protein
LTTQPKLLQFANPLVPSGAVAREQHRMMHHASRFASEERKAVAFVMVARMMSEMNLPNKNTERTRFRRLPLSVMESHSPIRVVMEG